MNGSADDARAVAATLARFFPPPAQVAASPIADHDMSPQEAALVERAVTRRRHEFSTGRALARDALRRLGFSDAPLLTGRLHEPLWPMGARGAISHDGAICAVGAMRDSDGAPHMGFDLVFLPEREGRMTKLAPLFVSKPDELDAARRVMAACGVATEPALMLFSLKESLVKALSAQAGYFIDLREMELRFSAGAACVTLRGSARPATLRAAIAGPYLVTAATLPV
ncbi:MAG: 4'-phosphopantetheinyl transferase superfamily protein [Alphaproteobacteria bacterium]|nr:4'-phosphopantetheinyl transferase superfamily protein [Alphaproteobacteria bacterium]MBM3652041.1 4'-phosphopantetheinyl transferase superfamily protein [Alphaproteobacteria bacterium]